VVSRLHGVILSMLAGTPIVALSYDRKVTALMDDAGLQTQCWDIRAFAPAELLSQVEAISLDVARQSTRLAEVTAAFRRQLDTQYDRLFAELGIAS
jgi:polysaccharide pyruvyl transferase WcaK-like protein